MTRLTPIHVRGKRKPKPPIASASHAPSANKHGRHEDHNPGPFSQRTKRSLNDALAHRKMIRPRSLIESLPLEVLESILLYCRSFALPRASHLIGAKLSGKATLFRLFFAAFHNTWEQGFGKTAEIPYVHDRSLRSDSRLTDRHGDPELQSEMIALPWAGIDFLLEAQQVWADRFARDRTYHHWMGKGSFTSNYPHEEKHFPLTGTSDSARTSRFDARACFEADYRGASATPTDWVIVPERMKDVHPLTRIPTRLITGPWSEKDRRRLFWLTRAGAAGHTTLYKHAPWETRVESIRNMIIRASEPDDFVNMCLMGTENLLDEGMDLWLYHALPADVAGDMVEEISKRLDWGDDKEETREVLRRTKGYLQDSITRNSWRQAVPRGGLG